MISNESPSSIGIPLSFPGPLELWQTTRLWMSVEFGDRGESQVLDAWQFRWMLLIPKTVCYLALIFISAKLLYGNADYIGWMI
jgi:hypothetical protein